MPRKKVKYMVYKSKHMIRCIAKEYEHLYSSQINRKKDALHFICEATEDQVFHPQGVAFATKRIELQRK